MTEGSMQKVCVLVNRKKVDAFTRAAEKRGWKTRRVKRCPAGHLQFVEGERLDAVALTAFPGVSKPKDVGKVLEADDKTHPAFAMSYEELSISPGGKISSRSHSWDPATGKKVVEEHG